MTTSPITREERERAVSWMRDQVPGFDIAWRNWLFGYEAALTAAEEENARLREALRPFAMLVFPALNVNFGMLHGLSEDNFKCARAALEGEGK